MASYGRLWEKVNKKEAPSSEKDKPLSADADKKAGYPPKCNPGYEVSKDGKKCVPIAKTETKPKSTTEALESPASEESPNKPDQEGMIGLSVKISDSLRAKVKEFNKDNEPNVTYAQLEKAFLRGASNRENGSPILCAFARANMYLAMRSGSPEYKIDREKTTAVNFLDITQHWIPNSECFAQAKEDVEKFGLNYDFIDMNDLYLTDYKKPIWNLY
jgi:hypothetical protein